MTNDEPLLPDFDALWDYNDPRGTEMAFRGLLPRAEAARDPSYLAELLTQIARCEGLQQHFDDAHRTLDTVGRLLLEAGDRGRIRYFLERGRVYNSSRRKEEALPLFAQALELASAKKEDFYAVDADHMMAIVESPEAGLQWNERAIEMAEQSPNIRARGWLGSLYNNLGWSYHNLGRHEDALATFERWLEWQREAGKEREARIAAWTVARTMRSLGRYEEALERQRENQRALQDAGENEGYTEEEIGECLLALGREQEAQPHFARAYTLLAGDPWLQRDEPERLNRLAMLGHVSA